MKIVFKACAKIIREDSRTPIPNYILSIGKLMNYPDPNIILKYTEEVEVETFGLKTGTTGFNINFKNLDYHARIYKKGKRGSDDDVKMLVKHYIYELAYKEEVIKNLIRYYRLGKILNNSKGDLFA